MDKDVIIIVIAGGTSSGKTTFAESLRKKFKDEITILKQDDYYKQTSHFSIEERRNLNFDHPNAIDFQLFEKHIEMLKNKQEIEKPMYDFTISDRIGYEVFVPKKIIIIEGILLLHNPKIRAYADIKIFIDAEKDIRVMRRIKRDLEVRKRSLESIFNQYKKSVKLMHEIYVSPSRKYADIIIPSNNGFKVGVDVVKGAIENIIRSNNG